MAQVWIGLGGLAGALGVAAGALGAHALKHHLDAAQLATFETAVRYQIYHALALVLVGLLAARGAGGWATAAGVLFTVGMVLFSGFIYAWLFSGVKVLVHIVPVGGVSLILGWIALGLAGFALKAQ